MNSGSFSFWPRGFMRTSDAPRAGRVLLSGCNKIDLWPNKTQGVMGGSAKA